MGNTLTLMNSTLGDSFDVETMRLTLEAMFNGTFFYGQQKEDGTADKDSGGILVKINTKTGETKLLLSESLNGVAPLFRNAVSYKGKLYFCGSVRTNDGKGGLPAVYEIDPKTDEYKVVYQGLSSMQDYGAAYKQGISTGIRGMCVHDGQLVISNVGKDANGNFVSTILTSSDPSKGQDSFTEIANSETLFGYPAIRYQDSIYGGAIWDMVSYNGHLYATICTGTPENAPDDNSMQSFAMVRGDKNADGSYSWTPIVGDQKTDGAKYCFGIDPARTRSGAANLIVYNDYLYIGEYNDEEIALERILFNKSNTEEGGKSSMGGVDCSFVNATLVISPFFTSHMISSIFSSDNCFSLLSCRILWACESDGIACAYSIATSSSLCSFSLNAAISTAGQKEIISSSSFCNISGISFVSEI